MGKDGDPLYAPSVTQLERWGRSVRPVSTKGWLSYSINIGHHRDCGRVSPLPSLLTLVLIISY